MGSEQSVPGALPQQPLDLPSITRSAACPYFSRTTSVTEGSGVLTGDLLLSNFVDILAQRNGGLSSRRVPCLVRGPARARPAPRPARRRRRGAARNTPTVHPVGRKPRPRPSAP